METTYYWDSASNSITFVSLTNRGQTSSGTVLSDDEGFVLLRSDGVLEDRFFFDKGQGWTQGHLIEYVER